MDSKITKKTLTTLPYDIQYAILNFQEPTEIIALYESSKDLIEEMIKHTNFIVKCKVVLSDKQIKWFESKNIKVKLLEEYKKDDHGNEYWYKNGKLHRDNDLPALIYKDGDKLWYKNDKLHRDNDLPSIILINGDKFWYKNGNSQRDGDLPAIILSDGSEYWCKNDKLHRDNDLPAMILADGTQYWYYNGVKYTPI
jgi:antitoxin component YwqK of YwqJK toxin-antitoxin module